MWGGQERWAGGSAPGWPGACGVGTSCGPGIRTRASTTLCPSVSLQNSSVSFSWQCPLHTLQDQNPLKALAGPLGEPPLPVGLSFLLCEVESQKHGCKLGSRVVTVSVRFLVGQTTYLPCPSHQVWLSTHRPISPRARVLAGCECSPLCSIHQGKKPQLDWEKMSSDSHKHGRETQGTLGGLEPVEDQSNVWS